MSQVTEQSVRFQSELASIKLIQASAVLDLTEDDFDFLTSNKVWIASDRSRARRCVEACVYVPVLYGNLPPREISMKDVFRSGDSSKKFKIAEGQWYRYAPSYVSPAYHLLEGFPFMQEPPSGDLQERVLIRHHDYDQCFQSVQLLQWNSQVKFNVTVYRNLPTTRDSIMTS